MSIASRVRPLSAPVQKDYQKKFPLLRRFYMDANGTLYGVQLRAAEPLMSRLVLLKLNPKTKSKEVVASALIQYLPGRAELFLHSVSHGGTFPDNPVAPKTKGLGFFRVLTNEAIIMPKNTVLNALPFKQNP